ncbi:sigma-70 family RNA polymerase sigma factor [Brevibacillus sp. SYSU BS000544]|uniref:sigma-70 family RNA polymerase sigma factor n=1 Tax=Brevibacillus sp. SYSU BS000544 TaxID=3416443 RepID=UPI003CE45360
MINQQENKSLDSLVQQFIDKVISFEDVLAAMRKQIHCITWRAANAFQRYKPVYDVKDYETIVLFALVKALEKWNPSKASFATYFEKVAYTALNDVRKEMSALSRQSNLDTFSWEFDIVAGESVDISYDDKGYKQSEFWMMYHELELTERQDVICKMIMQGYKSKEIASHLGISEGAVSMTLTRLRDTFKEFTVAP